MARGDKPAKRTTISIRLTDAEIARVDAHQERLPIGESWAVAHRDLLRRGADAAEAEELGQVASHIYGKRKKVAGG